MNEEKFSNIASELNEIFKYLEKDVLDKIPQDLKEQISKRKNPEYKCDFDNQKDFEEQNFMEETKQIMSVIFVEYCCTAAEREEIFEAQRKYESLQNEEKVGLEKLQQIFNQNVENDVLNNESKEIINIENVPWYRKIIDKIKKIFK